MDMQSRSMVDSNNDKYRYNIHVGNEVPIWRLLSRKEESYLHLETWLWTRLVNTGFLFVNTGFEHCCEHCVFVGTGLKPVLLLVFPNKPCQVSLSLFNPRSLGTYAHQAVSETAVTSLDEWLNRSFSYWIIASSKLFWALSTGWAKQIYFGTILSCS